MNRNIVMKFRATEEEAADIRRKASAAVNGQVVLYNTNDLYGLRSDIKRIGNNINQIAMVVNSNKEAFYGDIVSLKKQLSELSEKLNEHLKPLSYEVL